MMDSCTYAELPWNTTFSGRQQTSSSYQYSWNLDFALKDFCGIVQWLRRPAEQLETAGTRKQYRLAKSTYRFETWISRDGPLESQHQVFLGVVIGVEGKRREV